MDDLGDSDVVGGFVAVYLSNLSHPLRLEIDHSKVCLVSNCLFRPINPTRAQPFPPQPQISRRLCAPQQEPIYETLTKRDQHVSPLWIHHKSRPDRTYV